jgi:Family of unknown function (DUF5681)
MSRRTAIPQKDHCDSGAEAPGYEAGYGRPPRHTRFQRGQSGNRPKGSKSPKTVLEEVLTRSITITEGGLPRKIKLVEAIFMAVAAKAARGDLRAADLIFKLRTQFGPTGHDGEAIQPIIMQITESDLGLIEPPKGLAGPGREDDDDLV